MSRFHLKEARMRQDSDGDSAFDDFQFALFPNPLESVILSPMASEGLKTGSLPQREGTAK